MKQYRHHQLLIGATALILLGVAASVSPAAAQATPPARPQAQGAVSGGDPGAQQGVSKVVKTEATTFDSWVVTCDTYAAPSGSNSKLCHARESILNGQTRQLVATLVIGKSVKGELRLDARVPTSISVLDGVTLSLLPGADVKMPISFCEPSSCVASISFDAAMAARLQGAEKATLSWIHMASGPVKVEFPTKGAKEAIAAVGK